MVKIKTIFALSAATMMLNGTAYAGDAMNLEDPIVIQEPMDVDGGNFRAVCPTVDEINATRALPQFFNLLQFTYVNPNGKEVNFWGHRPRVDSIHSAMSANQGRLFECIYKYTDPNNGRVDTTSRATIRFNAADGLPAHAICRIDSVEPAEDIIGGFDAEYRKCGGAGMPQDCPMVCVAPGAAAPVVAPQQWN